MPERSGRTSATWSAWGREHYEDGRAFAAHRRRREAGETKPEWLELCILIGFAYLWLSMFMEWWG